MLADKKRLDGTGAITLRYENRPRAILRSPEFYEHRKEERCARQFGTTNPNHPYVAQIMDSGDWLVGGEVCLFMDSANIRDTKTYYSASSVSDIFFIYHTETMSKENNKEKKLITYREGRMMKQNKYPCVLHIFLQFYKV